MMTSTGSSSTSSRRRIRTRIKSFRNYEERLNRKRQQLEKQGPVWSDLPRDIFEYITGCLQWIDRIRIRAVCKNWSSVSIRQVPTIDNDDVKVPWAMTFSWEWKPTDIGEIYGECRLLDPLSREYLAEDSVRGEESKDFLYAIPRASIYGWVLFQALEPIKYNYSSFFLYSPFSTEVIKLPEFDEPDMFHLGTFTLNANSPKCVVFLIRVDSFNSKIRIKLCSPGDHLWKNYEFNNPFAWPNSPMDVVYGYGVFFCVFARGELGAFYVENEEWIVLSDHPITRRLFYPNTNLIMSDEGLLLLDTTNPKCLKLFNFDFSNKRWMYEKSLDNHVLFIGCTSFSTPAVGEISQLANTIFFCYCWLTKCHVTAYGSTRPGHNEMEPCGSGSLLYRKCLEAAKSGMTWIQPPLGGIWRANDLINAA